MFFNFNPSSAAVCFICTYQQCVLANSDGSPFTLQGTVHVMVMNTYNVYLVLILVLELSSIIGCTRTQFYCVVIEGYNISSCKINRILNK